MYRKANRNQLNLDEFILPFSGELLPDNRWVKMADIMPWEMIEDYYAEGFKNENPDGNPPIAARIAFGAIYIKENDGLTDRGTVGSIAENPYMQYFLGLKAFMAEPLFDASMMVHFRKRFPAEFIEKVNEEIYRRQNPPNPPEGEVAEEKSEGKNRGIMVLDATVAPADIRYPTDISILDECRMNTEKMIDELWEHTNREGHKTAYNRKKARGEYLKIIKKKRHKAGEIKAAIKAQLEYVKKNLETLKKLISESTEPLKEKRLERLETINIVVGQQTEMLEEDKHVVENRIVSLRQPHIRPIKRGKAGRPVEFGQKLSFSVVDGFTFIDVQSFDNFNEGITLIDSAEKYKEKHGVYPEVILGDNAYRNRANLKFCKQNGIRLSGWKAEKHKNNVSEDEQSYRDVCKRNIVESRNGIVKRRYGMDLIMTRIDNTSKTEAALNVLAMNIAHVLRVLLRLFFKWGFGWCFKFRTTIHAT
jgi:hypothetical protein